MDEYADSRHTSSSQIAIKCTKEAVKSRKWLKSRAIYGKPYEYPVLSTYE